MPVKPLPPTAGSSLAVPVTVSATPPAATASSLISILLTDINPNPHQPRMSIPEEQLKELADSIKSSGLIQPIQVTKRGDRYVLVAGQRRLEAVRKLGHTKIQALVVELTDEQLLQNSLIENLQREDLNPVDEAKSIAKLMELTGLTVEDLSKKIGKGTT